MKETSKLLLALGSSMVLSSATADADIIFAPAETISADTDVVTTGNLVQATSYGNTEIVNGVTFIASGNPTAGQFTVTLPGGTVNTMAFTSEAVPFSELSSAYREILQGAAFGNSNGGGGTVTLTGLTIGEEYLVQLFVGDPRDLVDTLPRTSEVNSGASTQGVDYNVGDVDGGLGQFVVGTFTATAASEVFNLTPTNTAGDQSVQLNAIQLRELTTRVTMDWVLVGDPGNAANNSTGVGGVNHHFRISKHEVTIGQYAAFLNSVAATDPHGLYHTSMASIPNIAGISRSGSPGSYSYSVIGTPNRPITYVNWFDGARFVNWLHNGQEASDTETGVYEMSQATPTASTSTSYRIPTEDEWYKAAYYDPTIGAGDDGDNYHLYATQSSSPPGNIVGASPNQANYRINGRYSETQSFSYSQFQNYLTHVGSFRGSASYYGTFDQNGNVQEFNDAVSGSSRGVWGGDWFSSNSETLMLSSNESIFFGPFENQVLGFRIAADAEPRVTFTPAVTIAADTDVVTTGTLVQATSYGTTQTVNGVTFTASGTPTAGQFTVTLPGGSVNTTAFTSGAAPFSDLSSAYRGLLQGAAFGNSNGGGGTVTLTGLTIGEEYLVQLFVGDPRDLVNTLPRTSEVNSANSTQGVDYNVGDLDGGLGQFVVGTFTAMAASEVFNLTPTNTAGDQSVQLNAIQLRALPDPDFDLLWPTDNDGDGSPFGVEIALGTDPDSADPDNPRNPVLANGSGDDVSITFGRNQAAPEGTRWILARSVDLVTFEEIFRFDGTTTVTNEAGNSVSITADQFQITDTDPPSPRAFYRFQSEYIAP